MDLPVAWNEKIKYHPEQERYYNCEARWILNHSGRRSGKTFFARRKLVRWALTFTKPNGQFVAAAPTYAQAKRIHWDKIKALIPPEFIVKKSESDLEILLVNGCTIRVMGLDRPERLEGVELDGILVDEFDNIPEKAWHENIRPALSTPGRLGRALLIGVPEKSGGLYQKLVNDARRDTSGDWQVFHWQSSDIVDPEEIEAARREMDERTFAQEYGGEFISYGEKAYYAFNARFHVSEDAYYDQDEDLHIALDFNISPGVMTVSHETDNVTWVIDEIYIPNNSNTVKVLHEFKKRYHKHSGKIYVYGDSTGGNGGSAQIAGSDWDLVHETLKDMDAVYRVPRQNPRERVRVNAMNARLMSASGDIRLQINPKCIYLMRDFDRVLAEPDGSLDKKSDLTLSHISDALGYQVAYLHPLVPKMAESYILR